MDQDGEDLFQRGLNRRGLPAAGMRGHFELPAMDADATQSSMRHLLATVLRLDRDQLSAVTSMQMSEALRVEMFLNRPSVAALGAKWRGA